MNLVGACFKSGPMAENIELLIRIQAHILAWRRLAASTRDPKMAGLLYELADEVEYHAREADRGSLP